MLSEIVNGASKGTGMRKSFSKDPIITISTICFRAKNKEKKMRMGQFDRGQKKEGLRDWFTQLKKKNIGFQLYSIIQNTSASRLIKKYKYIIDLNSQQGWWYCLYLHILQIIIHFLVWIYFFLLVGQSPKSFQPSTSTGDVSFNISPVSHHKICCFTSSPAHSSLNG